MKYAVLEQVLGAGTSAKSSGGGLRPAELRAAYFMPSSLINALRNNLARFLVST